MFILFLPGEYVLGKSEIVSYLDHFFLNCLGYRNTGILSGEPYLVLLLACGVDSLCTGSLLGVTNATNDLSGLLSCKVFAEEVLGVDSDEEVSKVIRTDVTVLILAVECLTVSTVLKNSGKTF